MLLQVRAKTFVAVGHETANKGEHGKNLRRDTMDANLLANMELGVHADAAPGRQTSDLVSKWLLAPAMAARVDLRVPSLTAFQCADVLGIIQVAIVRAAVRADLKEHLQMSHTHALCPACIQCVRVSCCCLQEGASGPYRTTTDEADGFFRTAKDPLEVDEDGIEMSSAPVAFGQKAKHGKEVVRRTESDQEQGLPPGLFQSHDATQASS